MKRLLTILWLAAICLAGVPTRLAAQDDGIVRLIVPYLPGGYPDTVARLVANQLSMAGRQTIVENRPGGAGVIATDVVAKAAPDGRTLLVADPQQWAVAPLLVKAVTYDIERDFVPVSSMTVVSNYIMVSSTVPVTGLAELVALIKAKPDAYNYGTPGVGSIHHLIFESFLQRIGGKVTQVPFKGGGEVAVALVSGQVQMAAQAMPAVAARVQEGKIKVIGVATTRRSPLTPSIPTLEELGVSNMDFPGELGVLAPIRTPREVITKLAAAIKQAVHAPATIEKLKVFAVEALGSSPDEFAKTIRADIAKFGEAVRVAGLKRE